MTEFRTGFAIDGLIFRDYLTKVFVVKTERASHAKPKKLPIIVRVYVSRTHVARVSVIHPFSGVEVVAPFNDKKVKVFNRIEDDKEEYLDAQAESAIGQAVEWFESWIAFE